MFDQEGLALERVIVSSDAFGSLPTYDEAGRLVRYRAADAKALLQFVWKMYFQELWPLDKILPLISTNPARILKLAGKGSLAVGSDADLLLLDRNTLQLKYVVAKGVLVKNPKWTHRGMLGADDKPATSSGSAPAPAPFSTPTPAAGTRQGRRRSKGASASGPRTPRAERGDESEALPADMRLWPVPPGQAIGLWPCPPASSLGSGLALGEDRDSQRQAPLGMFQWIPGCC